jgi:hypothetical protein
MDSELIQRLRRAVEDSWDFVKITIPRFFANVWRFRKELSTHQWWDYSYTLYMMRRSFVIIRDGLAEKGSEVPDSRLMKVAKITRAITILDNILESKYIEIAESSLGEIHPGLLEGTLTEEQNDHNSRVYDKARELEESEWKELFVILEGQDPTTFGPDQDWREWFDGSGIRGWWD